MRSFRQYENKGLAYVGGGIIILQLGNVGPVLDPLAAGKPSGAKGDCKQRHPHRNLRLEVHFRLIVATTPAWSDGHRPVAVRSDGRIPTRLAAVAWNGPRQSTRSMRKSPSHRNW